MFEKTFTNVANGVAYRSGLPTTFILCVALVVVWAVSGSIFGFSDTWQLVINTGTTIVTFLMVFLIQNTQNRDGAAMQAKLDELIRVTEAQNQFIGIEHLTETEVEEIRDKCEKAVKRHEMESASRQGRQNAEAQAAQELKKSFGKTAPANARKSSPAKSGRTSAKAGGAVR